MFLDIRFKNDCCWGLLTFGDRNEWDWIVWVTEGIQVRDRGDGIFSTVGGSEECIIGFSSCDREGSSFILDPCVGVPIEVSMLSPQVGWE